MIDLNELVFRVRGVAVEAGCFLKEQRAAFDRSVVQEKGPHDYVSYVDRASEERIVKALSILLPEAGLSPRRKLPDNMLGRSTVG